MIMTKGTVACMQVLGTPSREDIHAMNPNYTEFKFPQIKAHPWSKVFSKRLPTDAVDLVRHLADSSVPSSDFHVTHVRVLGRRDQYQSELQPLKCKPVVGPIVAP